MDSPIDWTRFVEVIRSASRILLTAHQRPDGDCLGSEIAMRLILQQLGKDVRVVNPHRTPPTLAFLDRHGVLNCLEKLTDDDRRWMDSADLFFVLDTSSWDQLGDVGPLFRESRAKKIVLDHHHKGDDIGAERFVDSTAEATGSLVIQAAHALKVPITKDIADAIFVALSTDTGWFRFASVTPKTYQDVAELLDAGVRPDQIYRELYEQESLGRIRLIGRTLAKTEAHFDGRVMFTRIMLEDLREAGALPSDSEDIVNMTLQVKTSKVAILVSELKNGNFKISLRSRCNVDCSQVAAQFGGGGHKKAAGATFKLPFEETKQALLEAIGKALEAERC